MSNPSRFLALMGVLLFSLCTASIANAAYADPSGRVARLNHTQGAVSYSPAGEDEWLGVVRNRPLTRGDRLWTDRDARAEFQVGSAAIRLGSNTSVEILDLSDRIAQIQMTEGTLNLSVRRMYPGQAFEVATPTLAFSINRAGRYRIDVDPRNAVTTVVVWEGAGEAYGENSRFSIRAGDTVRFYDTDLRDYEMYGLPREDDFDRYCLDRDRRLDRSASLRYIDDDVVGYADLDEYGSWRPVRSYGNVWFPSRVDADWAPYRDGHWIWQEPWGWTWVDDAPWGFAPSHYGRWVNVSDRWGWIPGPRNVRPIYAPALVAFVGGSGWSVSLSLGGDSPIGWFPLGPREVYVPSYQASRDYFTRVNVNNTVINNTTINNVYQNYSSGTINVKQVNYANRTVSGAVTAVPSTVFVNAQPVQRSALRLDRKAGTTGEITRVAPIAPSVRSVIGAGTAAGSRPSRQAIDRRVFVRNAPPPGERPFAVREQQLQKNPGRAPEPSAVKSVQSRDANTAQNVRVIGEQRGAVDARAAGSRRAGDKPGIPSAAPGQMRPLDRSVEPAKESGPGTVDHSRDKELKDKVETQQQEQQRQRKADSEQKAAEQQKAERQRQVETQQQEQQRQRKADSEQKAAEQQKAERQRQVETQQQEQQRQRKVDSEQKAAEQQQAERQRQVETQQQEQQRQRKADSEQKAAEQQQAERQRQVETQQQEQQRQRRVDSEQKAAEQQKAERQRQVETQQQEQQRQRKADSEQKAAEQQKAERQRQVETQQQEQQRQRKADSEQKAAEQQQAERQRQVETQQQEQQRQRKVDSEKQAAEQQQAGRQRQAEKQQQEQRQRKADSERQSPAQQQAECERQAIQQHQDVSQCRSATLPQERSDSPNRDKTRK